MDQGSSCDNHGIAVSIPALPAPEALPAAGQADMTELARAACARYGIVPDEAAPYPLTENWTYRVEDSCGSPSVLRIYRPGGRSPGRSGPSSRG